MKQGRGGEELLGGKVIHATLDAWHCSGEVGVGGARGGEALETPPHQPLPRPHSRPHQLAPYHYHHHHCQPQYVISLVCVMVDLEVGN